MLTRLGTWARGWASGPGPWTNVYGLARTLLAGSTALTLATNASSTLFRPVAGLSQVPSCSGVRGLGVFCVLPDPANELDLVRWLAVAGLLVVASGWRPRLTALLHFWIAVSFNMNAVTVDGGDQVAAILTLLMLPLALTDPRRWHWDPPPQPAPDASDGERSRIVARLAATLLRIQVAGIYFQAGVGKLKVDEWIDGTVLYYWFTSPTLGAPDWLMALLRPVLTHGWVALVTWSVLLLEIALAAGLLVPKRYRGALLWSGIALHAGIILVHGLVSFAIMMFAALVVYLRPLERELQWPTTLRAWAKDLGKLARLPLLVRPARLRRRVEAAPSAAR
jgi:antimicrobial peptide system SdpB family protein